MGFFYGDTNMSKLGVCLMGAATWIALSSLPATAEPRSPRSEPTTEKTAAMIEIAASAHDLLSAVTPEISLPAIEVRLAPIDERNPQ